MSDETPKRELSPMLAAYGEWTAHVGPHADPNKQCIQCLSAPTGSQGCDEGRRLWGNYRLARIAKAVPVSDGS